MHDVPYSPLLNAIFARYCSLSSNCSPLMTSAAFLVASIDIALLNAPPYFNSYPDFNESSLDIMARMYLYTENVEDMEAIRKTLKEALDSCGSVAFHRERADFLVRMREAESEAIREDLTEITPELLLKIILSDQSAFVKKSLAAKGLKLQAPPVKDMIAALANIDSDIPRGTASKTNADYIDSYRKACAAIREEFGDIPGFDENRQEAIYDLVEKIKEMHDFLSSRVLGQENAIGVLTSGYFQSEISAMTGVKKAKPRATFLFAGPPGVGKTMLATAAAEYLKLPFQRFDMSEYCDKEASLEFIGSDHVYKDSKKGNFTSFVEENPVSVVLFDEIEKAHISIIHLFLQMLDHGMIRDSMTDKEIDLSEVIMIFTTNAGKKLYEGSETNDLSAVSRKTILGALLNDVNPETKQPYFPAAICSRFASGNVVMFNHLSAYDLYSVARNEMLGYAGNFEGAFNLKIAIDEKVFSALLFSEGAKADARIISARASSFFNTEIYELFRLVNADKPGTKRKDLKKISFDVELPEDNGEISSLFERSGKETVLLVSGADALEKCRALCPEAEFVRAKDIADLKKVWARADAEFALIDMSFGRRSGRVDYLNIEDADSSARDIFWYIKEHYPDMPIYLLCRDGQDFKNEERLSFLRQGVRGFITLSDKKGAFAKEMKSTAQIIHRQRAIERLAKSSKLVTFETAQTLSRDGSSAHIRLFDFEFETAVDAADSESVLSVVSKPDARFSNVIGADDAIAELKYFVGYLKDPKKYLGTGVSAPKGVLLYGPPGTGKTLLAKAMAGESDVTFISAEGNQFLKKHVGEGPEKVHELFRTARKYAPSIIFIDEIDAIAKERRGEVAGAEATLTALLTEMDGFKNDTTKPVFVLAATNFDIDPGGKKSLDPALMRRFDRRICVDLPKRGDRVRYIKESIEGKEAFAISDWQIENIALRSTGMSLADLKSVIELSLRMAIRDGGLKVTDEIFGEAFETFNYGEAKDSDQSEIERTARHEAGHAFVYWESGKKPSYVTVVARGDFGGYMQRDGEDNNKSLTKADLLARIRTSLGGRAAELVYYGSEDGLSTGASSDLANATRLAKALVCRYGMDEKFGLAVIGDEEAREGDLAKEVRAAVNDILAAEMERAVELVRLNRPAIDELVRRLLADNHLSGEEIQAVFENAPRQEK